MVHKHLVILISLLFLSGIGATAQENFKDSMEIYLAKSEYRKAKMFSEKQVDKTRLMGEEGKLMYAEALSDCAAIKQGFGELIGADSLFKMAAAIQREKSGPASTVYSVSLMNLGNLQKEMSNYTEAEMNELQALEIYKNHGVENDTLLIYLNNVGLLYQSINNYGKSIYYYHKALDVSNNIGKKTGDAYTTLLNNLGQANYNTGNYNAAEEYFLTSLALMRSEPQPNLPAIATVLSNIASFYTNIENFAAAEPLITEALAIRKSTTGDSTTDYAIALNNKGNILMGLKKFAAADTAFRQAEAILRSSAEPGSLYYIRSLTNVASAASKMGNMAEAKKLLQKAINVCTKAQDSASPQYAFAVSRLGREYYYETKYKEAGPLLTESNTALKNIYGPGHPETVGSNVHLAELCLATGRFRKADTLILSVLDAEKTLLLNQLEFLSETELLPYLHQRQSSFSLPFSYLQLQYSPQVAKAAYNSMLLLKGVALQNTNSLSTLMQQSKDTVQQKQWVAYLAGKTMLNSTLLQPFAERKLNTDSLYSISNSREKLLLRQSASYRGMKEKLAVTGEDVQRKLRTGETAIEFVKFAQADKHGGDAVKNYYAALLLRPQDTLPIFVKLFDESQLVAALKSFPWKAGMEETSNKTAIVTATKANIYTLLWQPLEPYLKQTQTIYFAPDGLLHQVAFAAIADAKGSLLCDKYKLVQLTSTRQIALRNDNEPAPATYALFGGINYNNRQPDTATTIADPYAYAYRHNRGSGPDSFTYLPNTAKEVSNIQQGIVLQNKQVLLFSGQHATEAAFRKLGDGISPAIIHFATHGFALPNAAKQKTTGLVNTFAVSDNPLLRCGLVMAGGNKGWKGRAGMDEDDGILTALEISTVPLLNTQLAVLSACETAKGQLVGSEGIFGLQRAFKLAGVNYVMASLWKVPDAETAKFMNYFYTYLSGGKSIRQSFAATQQVMRKKYNPNYWAAFTLVQ